MRPTGRAFVPLRSSSWGSSRTSRRYVRLAACFGLDHLPRTSMQTKIDGIGDFDRAWARRSKGEFFGVPVGYLSIEDMLRTKRAAGRPKDAGDVAWLEEEV